MTKKSNYEYNKIYRANHQQKYNEYACSYMKNKYLSNQEFREKEKERTRQSYYSKKMNDYDYVAKLFRKININ
jgi:hypothetical protein